MELERLHLFGESRALSWAVRARDTIHVAGMVGMRVNFEAPTLDGYDFPDGIEAQMRQAYLNIGGSWPVLMPRLRTSLSRRCSSSATGPRSLPPTRS